MRDTFLYIPYVYDTLFTYSTADPAHPRLLSSTRVGVWPSDVVLGDERGYVALNGAEGVEVLDLTNPGYPVSRGQTSAPYAVRRLCYSNGLVYAAMWEAGVAIYETTVIGIHEQTSIAEESRGLRVWPSVTVGDVRFMVGPAGRSSDIGVYDISGKRLRDVRLQTELKGGTAEGVIDLAGLAAGVYVVRVESEGKNLTTKVVKTNRR